VSYALSAFAQLGSRAELQAFCSLSSENWSHCLTLPMTSSVWISWTTATVMAKARLGFKTQCFKTKTKTDSYKTKTKTKDSFFFHVIFYVILHFKINIIIPNLISCQKTIPRPRRSYKTKTKTETLGIKTKTKTKLQDQDRDLRHQDQDQDQDCSVQDQD